MARIDDIELVRRDYSDPSRLEERFRAWREYHEPDLLGMVQAAVAEERPRRVLEVGCGDGRFSLQMRDELGVQVLATDYSPGMAAQAAQRGLDVQICDIQRLPYPSGMFDVVVANWMLYHVPNMDSGLGQIRRVLRDGGRLIASTMGRRHMRELWDRLQDGDDAPDLEFGSENGAEVLARHFDHVETRSMGGHATFPDHAAAVRHIRATLTRAHLAERLEPFDGPLRVTTDNVMFVARRDDAHGARG